MNDLSRQISQAAFEALSEGADDSARVVDLFRQRAPRKFHFPSTPTAGDLRSFHRLLEHIVGHAAAVHARPTTGFASAIALGKNLDPHIVGASGFLISPDVVATAGHALDKDEENDVGIWRHDSAGNPIRLLPISEKKEEKERRSQFHDIGLIRLAAQVADVEIYSLASRAAFNAAEFLTIVGFGVDENGRFGEKKTATVNRRTAPIAGVHITADQFFIGDPSLAEDGDACFRDSGGPILVDNGDKQQVAGIISGPIKKGRCGDGTICLHLDGLTEWIDKNIQELGGQPRPA